jgi:hypothetical protein
MFFIDVEVRILLNMKTSVSWGIIKLKNSFFNILCLKNDEKICFLANIKQWKNYCLETIRKQTILKSGPKKFRLAHKSEP